MPFPLNLRCSTIGPDEEAVFHNTRSRDSRVVPYAATTTSLEASKPVTRKTRLRRRRAESQQISTLESNTNNTTCGLPKHYTSRVTIESGVSRKCFASAKTWRHGCSAAFGLENHPSEYQLCCFSAAVVRPECGYVRRRDERLRLRVMTEDVPFTPCWLSTFQVVLEHPWRTNPYGRSRHEIPSCGGLGNRGAEREGVDTFGHTGRGERGQSCYFPSAALSFMRPLF